MGNINILAVFCAAAAFFLFGMVWYGWLFNKAWFKSARMTEADIREGHNMVLILALAFAFELLIALMLGHQFARTMPSPRAMMMISTGFGATIMTPALGINYLFQRKPGKLFAIDAAHLIIGMTLMGLVFLAFR
ncbi:DUF1761 family protein [Altererythrobacter indicus]|uniref:DUF1761 family protein n=1 Tax=Altericroceibacterium indicum TaxID=374177 RepID=A0A845A4B2_9SPHN|nr:DUF1761 domain-containing protein [Altericroceibacterium indicum]MXP24574.1 DUF1761 family protein [Altericroceibacterium indicum]